MSEILQAHDQIVAVSRPYMRILHELRGNIKMLNRRDIFSFPHKYSDIRSVGGIIYKLSIMYIF